MTQPTKPLQIDPPPRAFGQGVGTVFQFVGVILFVCSMFVCCGSSLMSKESATQTSLTHLAWGGYSAQKAITVSLVASVFFGLALAAIGLGLQAQNRQSPRWAVLAVSLAIGFWIVHLALFIHLRLWLMGVLSGGMCVLFVPMLVLAIGAWREMRRNPTPAGFELLPSEYKVPYSHMHDDPPEVRLERELDQRRQRLAVQQKELELLEEKLRRKMKEKES